MLKWTPSAHTYTYSFPFNDRFVHSWRHQRPLGQMAVANDLAVAALILNSPVRIDPLGDFRFKGLAQQPLGAIAQNASQHVLGADGWQ